MLRRGMTLAVEPMVVAGRRDVDLYEDGWTVFTEDRMPAAHFEHTVAITDTGVDVLTDGRSWARNWSPSPARGTWTTTGT